MLTILGSIGILYLIIAIIRLVVYRRHVIWYGRGMVAYRISNWEGRWEAWSMLLATRDEIREVVEAIIDRDFSGFIAELCDVNHAIIMTIALLLFGSLMKNTIVYWLFYIICPFTAWKHGERYRKYGCVRSLGHHDKHGNSTSHKCSGKAEKISLLQGNGNVEIIVD